MNFDPFFFFAFVFVVFSLTGGSTLMMARYLRHCLMSLITTVDAPTDYPSF